MKLACIGILVASTSLAFASGTAFTHPLGDDMTQSSPSNTSEAVWQQADVMQIENRRVRNWLWRLQGNLNREYERRQEWIDGPAQDPDFVVHSQDSHEILADYVSPEAMADAFLNSLQVLSSAQDHSSWMIYWGFDLPFDYELQLPYAQLRNDQRIAMPMVPGLTDGPDQTVDIQRFSPLFQLRSRPQQREREVASLGGQFQADLPLGVYNVDFTDQDLNKTQRVGGYLMTLTDLEPSRFSVHIKRDPDYAGEPLAPLRDGDLRGLGKTADGRLVEQIASTRFNAAYLPTLNDWINARIADAVAADAEQPIDLDVWEQQLQALESSLNYASEDVLQEGVTVTYATFGYMQAGRITLLQYPETPQRVQRELRIPVQFWSSRWPHPIKAFDELPITAPAGPVYDGHWELEELPVEAMAEALLSNFTTHLDDFSKAETEQLEEIAFKYPSVMTDLLTSAQRIGTPQLESVQFFDQDGEPLAVPGSDDAVSVDTGKLLYRPYEFERWPYRVTLTLPVTRVDGFQRERFHLDALPTGVYVQGNRLVMADSAVPDGSALVVGDDHGVLKLMARSTVSLESDPQQAYEAALYYGEPRWVEMWSKQDVSEHMVEITVDLQGPMQL